MRQVLKKDAEKKLTSKIRNRKITLEQWKPVEFILSTGIVIYVAASAGKTHRRWRDLNQQKCVCLCGIGS